MLMKKDDVSEKTSQPLQYARIGIGITTHNRRHLLKKTLSEIQRLSPPECRIVIVDDASDIPVEEATFRFEKNVGIARAKNKCFELLQDCEYIFLFDDDTYPLRKQWWRPYIESDEPHLCYMFERFSSGRSPEDVVLVYENGKIKAWSHARGCMLYFRQECLQAVGGMDPVFGRWGYEHIELSSRIYNAGLTSFKFMDINDSKNLFWSADEHEKTVSSVPDQERLSCLCRNQLIWERLQSSKRYVPYIASPVTRRGQDVIITCYLTRRIDPQRGIKWKADYSKLHPLIRSLQGQKLILIHDCFNVDDTEHVEHVKINPRELPYWQRWISIYQWLIKHPEVERVFCVDATDVEMLRNPFPEMEDQYLYVGYENTHLGNAWMRKKHPAAFIQTFIDTHKNHKLLNCGLLGGKRELLIDFLGVFLHSWASNKADVRFRREKTVGDSDMGLFNVVLLKQFAEKISFGEHINTPFKSYKTNDYSWWKHK